MLPVIPRKAVIGTYQCTDDVACDPQEGSDWYLLLHRWCCLWSPGRQWLVLTSAQMMLPVIPRKVVVYTYQCTDDVACDPQEGCGWYLPVPVHRWCCLWSPGRQWLMLPVIGSDWYLPVHRWCCLWSPGRLWFIPTSAQMMLPVIPRKVVVSTYQCTDDVACDPQEGCGWYLPVHRWCCLWSPGRLWLVPTSTQMMLPVIPRKVVISTYQCTNDVCDHQEGCGWYLPVHRCSCLWSPGRLWLVPTSAQMMLPVIPRKAMIGRTMP